MKRGTPRHPKVAKLAELCGIELTHAIGILEALWHFTAEFSPAGDIGRFSDKEILRGIFMSPADLTRFRRHLGVLQPSANSRLTVGKLSNHDGCDVVDGTLLHGNRKPNVLECLQSAGFLEYHSEHRLIVHDWQEHCDQAVERKVERAKIQFATRDMTSQQLDNDKQPCLAKPSLAIETALTETADKPPTKKRTVYHGHDNAEFRSYIEIFWKRDDRRFDEKSSRWNSAWSRWDKLTAADRAMAFRHAQKIEREHSHIPFPEKHLSQRDWAAPIPPQPNLFAANGTAKPVYPPGTVFNDQGYPMKIG